MKKQCLVVLFTFVNLFTYSQMESQIIEAVSFLEPEIVEVDNSYLQGEFINSIKKDSADLFLDGFNHDGFKRFTKMVYLDGKWDRTITIEEDSSFVSTIREIQLGLPPNIDVSPSSVEINNLVDESITDYWEYINNDGERCEIRVYFINGQLKSIGYWVHE